MKLKYYVLWGYIAITLTASAQINYPAKLIVNVPVANLREIPQAHDPLVVLPTSDETNPLQITQLLLGEQILAHEEFIDSHNNKWFKINTLQQEYFYPPLGWHGFPGWIQADQTLPVQAYPEHNTVARNQLIEIFDHDGKTLQIISIGTRLCATQTTDNLWLITLPDRQIGYVNHEDLYQITPTISESLNELRSNIITTALTFIGNYYSWGGRKSAQFDQFGLCSVDCSALIHLSFLAHGLQIPRMSHEQFLRSEKIQSGADLQPGDLIFFSSIKKQSARMDHVMLYLGDNQILESTFADDHKVRVISSQQRLHKPIEQIKADDVIDDTQDQYHIYFGSFFNDRKITQKLRDDALRYEY